jgi:hypothetical protein
VHDVAGRVIELDAGWIVRDEAVSADGDPLAEATR